MKSNDDLFGDVDFEETLEAFDNLPEDDPPRCLSCGGIVSCILDNMHGFGSETGTKAHCEHCGDVWLIVLTDDGGYPVQGFMSNKELQRCGYYELPPFDPDTIPF